MVYVTGFSNRKWEWFVVMVCDNSPVVDFVARQIYYYGLQDFYPTRIAKSIPGFVEIWLERRFDLDEATGDWMLIKHLPYSLNVRTSAFTKR